VKLTTSKASGVMMLPLLGKDAGMDGGIGNESMMSVRA